jgi:hypothetical protein
MAKAEKSWEKRLAGELDELMVDLVESLSIDKRFYEYDIVWSIAHAQIPADILGCESAVAVFLARVERRRRKKTGGPEAGASPGYGDEHLTSPVKHVGVARTLDMNVDFGSIPGHFPTIRRPFLSTCHV